MRPTESNVPTPLWGKGERGKGGKIEIPSLDSQLVALTHCIGFGFGFGFGLVFGCI